jgi:micrococcal nuclease
MPANINIMTRKIISQVIGGIIILAIAAGLALGRGIFNEKQKNTTIQPAGNENLQNNAVTAKTQDSIVTKVIDGDTVVVQGGDHVRLLGMDADEKGYPCYDAAKTRLEVLTLSKPVRLEVDATDKDQYGRLLRYIFVGSRNIDEELVAEGLAVARFYPENQKYKTEITAAESLAIKNKTGCKWSGQAQTTNAVVPVTQTNNQSLTWQKLTGGTIIDACDSAKHVGENVTIQGVVADAYQSSSQTMFLDFNKPYPDNCFAAVIFKSSLDKFQDPQNSYTNKTVRVSGKVSEYQGKPEIILNDPSQIEVGN